MSDLKLEINTSLLPTAPTSSMKREQRKCDNEDLDNLDNYRVSKRPKERVCERNVDSRVLQLRVGTKCPATNRDAHSSGLGWGRNQDQHYAGQPLFRTQG